MQTKSSNPKDVLAASETRVPLALIPSTALVHIATAMLDGAEKYGAYNWREEGVGAMTYVSAAMRHLRAWLDGEESAQDSKAHHLAHATACLCILMDAQELGNLVDDRPEPAPTSEMMEAVKKEGRQALAHRPTGFNVLSPLPPEMREQMTRDLYPDSEIGYDFDAARAYRQRLREEYDLD